MSETTSPITTRIPDHRRKELRWYSPGEAPCTLAGFPWFAQDHAYRRLPRHTEWTLPRDVDALADNTAGGQIRFQTNATCVALHARVTKPAGMHHMPPSGQCGFDCYIGPPHAQRYWRTTIFAPKDVEYECKFMEGHPDGMRNFTINFPLYEGVASVKVGISAEADILPPPPYDDDRPIIFYGTSITQGGCASRPGMAYTNILSRRLNRECINLGFSGAGRGEPEMADLITKIPHPGCYVLDYEANGGSLAHVQKTFPAFIHILRNAHPTVPILALSRVRSSTEALYESTRRAQQERREFQQRVIETLRRQGDAAIYYVDGSTLLGDDYDECTVDGSHPTDLGFMRMANALQPVLARMLGAG